GAMVDTRGASVAVLPRMLSDLQLPPVDRAFVERTIGKGSEHLIRATLHHVGGAPSLYHPAWQRYQAHYRQINGGHADVYPGVVEGLQRLRAAGRRLACLTNKPTAFA